MKLKKNLVALCLAMAVCAGMVRAADPPQPSDVSSSERTAELARLKAQLEEQKKQIEQLRSMLETQSRLLDQVAQTTTVPAPAALPAAPVQAAAQAPASEEHKIPSQGEIASATPMVVPNAAPAPAAGPRSPMRVPYVPPPAPQTGEPPVAPNIRIGDSYITPIGFMDMTGVFRSTATNFGIGTNFGSIPFNNSFPLARLTEFRLNPQNSRLGARFDTKVHDWRVIGYWESDFLGGSGSNNLSVSSNSWVFRMRLYWVDVRKGQFEFLAGQSWSLITPGRNGISPLPGDIFFSQNIDVNYQAGLTWGRIPGFRFVYHPSSTVAAAVSLEQADQYIGGSGGGTTITLPTNLPATFVNQLDNASNSFQTPNLHPDIIGKLAFDPITGKTHQHVELVGVYRTFRTYNQNNNSHFNTPGGGFAVNMNFEPVKNVHPILNTYWSNGGGRYLFGVAPDLVVRTDGSTSAIHSYGGIAGIEANVTPTTLLYAYYGAIYIGKNVVLNTNGTPAGYGYTGSNGFNRSIQEPTIGFNQTFWRDPKWGALNFMFQYSWLNRIPWYVPVNTPKNAHQSIVYINLRYTLPGSAPVIK
jgi:hypothetical protein